MAKHLFGASLFFLILALVFLFYKKPSLVITDNVIEVIGKPAVSVTLPEKSGPVSVFMHCLIEYSDGTPFVGDRAEVTNIAMAPRGDHDHAILTIQPSSALQGVSPTSRWYGASIKFTEKEFLALLRTPTYFDHCNVVITRDKDQSQ